MSVRVIAQKKTWVINLLLEDLRKDGKMQNEFVKLYKKYIKRRGADKLLSYLVNNGFLEAPASTKYHGSYEGGLVEHSVNVMNRLMRREILRDYTKETLAIAGLLHDVCKLDNYIKQETDGKETYEYNKNAFPAGHGEKSIFIIQRFMNLTDEEILAIRWHMGAFDDAVRGGSRDINAAYKRSKLAVYLNLADMAATYIDE